MLEAASNPMQSEMEREQLDVDSEGWKASKIVCWKRSMYIAECLCTFKTKLMTSFLKNSLTFCEIHLIVG